jgi:hypothetical protein
VWLFSTKESPYIANPNRLADLIAAIQILGTYRFASRHIEKWEKRLGRTPVSAGNWTIVTRHPEFVATQRDDVSLVWRRYRKRNYDAYSRTHLPREDAMKLAN